MARRSWPSAQAFQVVDERVQVVGRQVRKRGHECAGLERLWIANPVTQVLGGVPQYTGAECVPAPEVRQVGSDAGCRGQSLDGVTADAGVSQEDLLASRL